MSATTPLPSDSAAAQDGYIFAEYVWIGGGGEYRCKTMTIAKSSAPAIKDLRVWNYDGSSTAQAPGDDSEVYIRPCAVFNDPIRGKPNIIVMCDTYKPSTGKALDDNNREAAAAIFEQVKAHEPWFGIEQEYTMFKDGRPLGWPSSNTPSGFGGLTTQVGYPGPQGPYYCSVGANCNFGRSLVEEHMKACMYAGIKISGTNAEVMPGQWEYQVGPCTGIDSGDQLHMSRFLLQKLAERYEIVISFDPKPIPGDWNGAGCHTNYSTKAMREDGGYKVIVDACEKLGKKHEEHIAAYGEGNDRRLTGLHETASIDKFSYGVANRGCSIRIPRDTEKDQKGYLEDRRPASNMDPYTVTSLIAKTTIL